MLGTALLLSIFALFNLGGGELVLVLALVLILFGAKRLPGITRRLGQGYIVFGFLSGS